MSIFHSIINQKINTVSDEDLWQYAKQFKINVTKDQAKKIASYLRGKKINIFNDDERKKVIREIAGVTGPETAKEVNQLFLLLTKNL
ncbi:DUF2624 domain-containing protein [Bacillaceae bacterium Marseille-Q3522]|nr:DUF2624 domain-containing protein [Bacillaceae bacterium Marseille-Q3522]